jgi:hypothetical protein
MCPFLDKLVDNESYRVHVKDGIHELYLSLIN